MPLPTSEGTDARVVAFAPGRVNLIGEHTDYTGGLVLPMAVQMGTTVTGTRRDGEVTLRSDRRDGDVQFSLPPPAAGTLEPAWGRFAAGVAEQLGPDCGFDGNVSSDLPIGAGLSSSSSLTVALTLAFGGTGHPPELARLALAAEVAATGVPGGLMDQLCSLDGRVGHALLIDCETDERTPVELPDRLRVLVVDSQQHRTLAATAYADRRAECEAAIAVVGPLRRASLASLDQIADDTVASRARHVITENERVLAFCDALDAGDIAEAGRLVDESHASLRDDFEVSTDIVDTLVDQLRSEPSVLGARLTGAGFGGCVVALVDADVAPVQPENPHWWVEPSMGARVNVE